MSLIRLAWQNAWRKPLRTLLLIFCVAVAFHIYGLTSSFLAGAHGSSGADDRLVVSNRASKAQPLPLGYTDRISRIDGVKAVAYTARLQGFIENERNVVVASAVDPVEAAAVFGKELGLTPDKLAALGAARDRVLVGKALAEAQGWSIGQRVSVTAFRSARIDGSRNWSFEIAGIFEGKNASVDTYYMIARYDFVNAMRADNRDTVDNFVVLVADGTSPSALAPKIDALFANSAAETRTQPERQFLEAAIRQIADIGMIVDLVVGAAFITILMIVVNTMIFAVRERTFEIGLLKTLGFSSRQIMSLVVSETTLIFIVGGIGGVVLAAALAQLADASIGLAFTPRVMGKATLLVLALGVASGLLPALNAMRTPIIRTFQLR